MTDRPSTVVGARARRTEAEVLAARLLPAPPPDHPCLPGYAELVAVARAVVRLGGGAGGGSGR
jgi:hypothetical protein